MRAGSLTLGLRLGWASILAAVSVVTNNFRLLEDGNFRLLEDGNKRLMEDG